MNDSATELILTVTTTVGSMDDARELGRALVERRLAACVQLEPVSCSIYRWEGRLCEDPEVRLVIKTMPSRRTELFAAFGELHPYELPQFTAAVMDASPAYRAWVESEVAC